MATWPSTRPPAFEHVRLSKDGEELVLSYLPGTAQPIVIADAVRFKAQEQGVSLGRYPDGGAYWFRLTPSRGAANTNPIPDVVIDEIMYHPIDPNEEYIELYNPTNQAGGPAQRRGRLASRRGGGLQLPRRARRSRPAAGW